MMSYGGDMYMQSYDSDAWGWGAQQWGTGYEQVTDMSWGSWGYQPSQQPWQQHGAYQPMQAQQSMWQPTLPPHAASQPQMQPQAHSQQDHQVRATSQPSSQQGQSQGPAASDGGDAQQQPQQEAQSTSPSQSQQSQKQPSQQQPHDANAAAVSAGGWCSDGAQGASGPKVGSELLTELRLAELKRLLDRDRQTAEAAAGAPGLEAPAEQMHVAVANWEPKNRQYGEMPVRAGEEIWVSADMQNEWIYGCKRGDNADEGWIPASALGLLDDLSTADSDDGREEEAAAAQEGEEQVPERASARRQLQRRRELREEAERARERERQMRPSRCAADEAEAEAPAPARSRAQAAGSSKAGRKEDYSGGGAAEKEDQGWHEHGNWWSKQRHLKGPEKETKSWTPQRQSQSSGRKGGGRGTGGGSGATYSDGDDDYHSYGASTGRGAGRGGRGAGRGGPMRPRERGALASLLERLSKPLEPPKQVH
mmetsp:Transcript_128005/g.368798  ORF Transcript_128005/g.368798 Transcript_128005/m.368798 type:complete len:479 (+) Transcript_128005:33-1469(+)